MFMGKNEKRNQKDLFSEICENHKYKACLEWEQSRYGIDEKEKKNRFENEAN